MDANFTARQLQVFSEVLATEAASLHQISAAPDPAFAAAVAAILAISGRTILTGMGKSGHIAGKIAATMASTGTPAFFVHPAEAAHGDLGMIMPGDIIIALSYSGESDEILTLVPALKRKKIPIISITGRPQSSLAKVADINIPLTITQEACPLGLAPTTSTTATLAVGDALAVALLNERHFTRDDFALSHPAGSLGKSLLTKVTDLMVTEKELPTVSPQADLREVIMVMTAKGLGLAVVTDREYKVIGIFTDGDLRRLFQNRSNLDKIIIKDVMNPDPQTASPSELASTALHLMQKKQIASLPVVDRGGKLQGIITMHILSREGII